MVTESTLVEFDRTVVGTQYLSLTKFHILYHVSEIKPQSTFFRERKDTKRTQYCPHSTQRARKTRTLAL
jgi:hypothetical protein